MKFSNFRLLSFLILFLSQTSFSQNSEIQIREENNQFAIFNGEKQITPFLFNSLSKINDSLYLFDANPSYRGKLQKMISGAIHPPIIQKKSDENDDYSDPDISSIFTGLINQEGKILCGEQFRMIEKIEGENLYPPFFQAQNEQLFNKKDNGEYALVNAEGIVLTKYSYFIFYFKDNILFGQKIINSDTGETVTVKFDQFGKVIN